MSFEIATVEQQGDARIVTPHPRELEVPHIQELDELWRQLGEDESCHRLIVCFRNVEATAWRAQLSTALVKAHKRMAQRGGQFTLCEVPEPILDGMRPSRLDQILHIIDNLPDALAEE